MTKSGGNKNSATQHYIFLILIDAAALGVVVRVSKVAAAALSAAAAVSKAAALAVVAAPAVSPAAAAWDKAIAH